MITNISISQPHAHQLEDLAKKHYPMEACALLEGKIVAGPGADVATNTAMVLGIIPIRNSDESPNTFSMDPIDLINAYQDIGLRSLEVVGIFHSHNSLPLPSSTDIKYMELNPVVWLIYSTSSNSYSAYILDTEIMQVALRITT